MKNKKFGTKPIVFHANGPAKTYGFFHKLRDSVLSSESTKKPCSNDVSVYIVNSKKSKGLAEQTCEKNGVPYQVLNDGKPGWLNARKLSLILDALKHTDTDYTMVLDSFDVVVTDGTEEILKRFKESGKKILFNSEIYAWPVKEECPQLVDVEKYEKETSEGSPFCHLNSGVWIGHTDYALWLYEEVKKLHGPPFSDSKHWNVRNSDQGIIRYFAKDKPEIGRDYKCKVFQALFKTTGDMFDV